MSDNSDINSFEQILIAEDMERRGIKTYGMQRGNNCVWVWYGYVNAYYSFRNGQIHEIQYD